MKLSNRNLTIAIDVLEGGRLLQVARQHNISNIMARKITLSMSRQANPGVYNTGSYGFSRLKWLRDHKSLFIPRLIQLRGEQ